MGTSAAKSWVEAIIITTTAPSSFWMHVSPYRTVTLLKSRPRDSDKENLREPVAVLGEYCRKVRYMGLAAAQFSHCWTSSCHWREPRGCVLYQTGFSAPFWHRDAAEAPGRAALLVARDARVSRVPRGASGSSAHGRGTPGRRRGGGGGGRDSPQVPSPAWAGLRRPLQPPLNRPGPSRCCAVRPPGSRDRHYTAIPPRRLSAALYGSAVVSRGAVRRCARAEEVTERRRRGRGSGSGSGSSMWRVLARRVARGAAGAPGLVRSCRTFSAAGAGRGAAVGAGAVPVGRGPAWGGPVHRPGGLLLPPAWPRLVPYRCCSLPAHQKVRGSPPPPSRPPPPTPGSLGAGCPPHRLVVVSL